MIVSMEMIHKRLSVMNDALRTDFELYRACGGYQIVNKRGSKNVSDTLNKAELVQWLNGFFACMYKQY